MPKYKFINGVMVLNDPPTQSGTQSSPQLAIVSTQEDIAEATMVNTQSQQIPQATIVALEKFDNSNLSKEYKSPVQLDGANLLDKLAEVFSMYEVPIGLLSKVLNLSKYNLNIIIDDSSSMGNITEAKVSMTGNYMKKYYQKINRNFESNLTRWEEAEDVLHIMIDILAYIPSETIRVHFLNRSNQLVFDRTGMEPTVFASKCHDDVRSSFTNGPNGLTPIYKALSESFNMAKGNTMHYLFTDGEPSDTSIFMLEDYIINRSRPQQNPLALIGCTDDEESVEWMEDMERNAMMVSAIDYFDEERKNMQRLQGPVFPYSKGFWLICILVAPINPDDLDDLDSYHPLTKFTLDNLMGRNLTLQEYNLYWSNHPRGQECSQYYTKFSTEQKCCREIMGSARARMSTTTTNKLTSIFKNTFKNFGR